MKDLDVMDQILLPVTYRKWGYRIITFGIPLVLIGYVISALSIGWDTRAVWDEWGLYLLHIPLSIGLYFTFLSREPQEDEYYLSLRMKAAVHGIRFIFFGVILLPVISNLYRVFLDGKDLGLPDLGGNLAVVTLLLFYANVSYFILKNRAEYDEEN